MITPTYPSVIAVHFQGAKNPQRLSDHPLDFSYDSTSVQMLTFNQKEAFQYVRQSLLSESYGGQTLLEIYDVVQSILWKHSGIKSGRLLDAQSKHNRKGYALSRIYPYFEAASKDLRLRRLYQDALPKRPISHALSFEDFQKGVRALERLGLVEIFKKRVSFWDFLETPQDHVRFTQRGLNLELFMGSSYAEHVSWRA